MAGRESTVGDFLGGFVLFCFCSSRDKVGGLGLGKQRVLAAFLNRTLENLPLRSASVGI